MRPNLIPLALAAASSLAALAPSPGTAAEPTGRLRVGEPFPDLVLPALDDGRPRALSEFRGRKVVLQVFASW